MKKGKRQSATADAKPVRVKWFITTGYSGAGHEGVWEIDRAEWDRLGATGQGLLLDQFLKNEMQNHIDMGYSVVED